VRRSLRLLPLALLSGCAGACSITRALYSAVVHNSGAPPRAELSRIDEREIEFLRALPHKRVVVLPVAVLGTAVRYDSVAAARITDTLRSGIAPEATSSAQLLSLPFTPQPNEAAILWQRFGALADSVAAHRWHDADYVVLVDVLGASERGRIGAVHVMVVTGNGTMVFRRLWNSHQALYKEVMPRSIDDAGRMVVTELRRGVEARRQPASTTRR